MCYLAAGRGNYFNPRPHAGDDILSFTRVMADLISTHVPTRGTTRMLSVLYSSSIIFQPTSPRGGRHHVEAVNIGRRISTHVPTRGTTSMVSGHGNGIGISTHVPTRGTTLHRDHLSTPNPISTHVPTRGTTLPSSCGRGGGGNFNPRPHAGDDLS